MKAQKNLMVIGGGAAGFFCAINAASKNPDLKVILLEKSSKLLSKVKISGGGRCNVTHACFHVSDLVKSYPRGTALLKKAFHHFNTQHTIEWFANRGVTLKTEADGRMFPVTDSSQTIIDCLLTEVNRLSIEVRMNADVVNIKPNAGKASTFEITLSNQKILSADFVCIACGGFPKISQFEWISNLGLHIQTPVPSLFTFNMPGNKLTSLMGVSVPEASVKIMGTKLQQTGPLLITHWGISGPAVLKLSAWAAKQLAENNYDFDIMVNWLPTYNEQLAAQKIINRNPFALPSRLWEHFLEESEILADARWADLPSKPENKLIKALCSSVYEVKGKTTFKEEFVTAGGVDIAEIDAQTMECKKIRGLFFAGEILDVDGITGGFNFQNAWTSGWLAAEAIAKAASAE
jgi:predicted Rossmann fold flavoprotein